MKIEPWRAFSGLILSTSDGKMKKNINEGGEVCLYLLFQEVVFKTMNYTWSGFTHVRHDKYYFARDAPMWRMHKPLYPAPSILQKLEINAKPQWVIQGVKSGSQLSMWFPVAKTS